MSFIPSFILSALFFCNVTVPGGFDGATLTEGVICEIPYTSFVLSVEENPAITTDDTSTRQELQPELKNAAFLFKIDTLSLTLAAGSLAVSGTDGSARLSAKLPDQDDGTKDPAVFISWKSLALLGTEERAVFQFYPGFFRILPDASIKTELSPSITAGWTKLTEPTDTAWFLRYPWHEEGNLYYLDAVFSTRLSFTGLKLTAHGTASLSFPDIIPAEAAGALKLLMETKRTKTTLSYAATPPAFVLPTGYFTADIIKAEAAFTFEDSVFKLSVETAAAQKQPAAALELSKCLHSAGVTLAYKGKEFKAGVGFQAEKLCFDDDCRDGELSPKLELTLYDTTINAKATFLPFHDEEEAEDPVWSVKVTRTVSGLTVSYTAEFDGTWLDKQEFSIKDKRETGTLTTAVTIKDDSLTWNLSFSKKW